MKLNKVHPDYQSSARWIPALPYHWPPVRMLVNALIKLIPPFKGDASTTVRWAAHGPSRSKIYQPASPASDAALLWIHGGGYLCFSANTDDATCRRIVDALGITVVSVDYRLAPQSAFPAALDDCVASWEWLQQHSVELGVDPQRIVVAGESAGGGLAATLAQRLLDEGGPQPVAQWLLAPMLDDRTATREDLTAEQHFVWNNRNNWGGWQRYLGQDPGLPEAPTHAVAARRESLAGLPETFLAIGDLDLFYEECVTYAERLQSDGVACELFVTEGGVHGMETLLPASSPGRLHWDSVFAFLGRKLNLNQGRRTPN